MTRGGALREMVSNYNRVEVAVILVKAGETKEKAWQRYLGEHPECNRKGVRIFHLVPKELPEDFALHQVESRARSREDDDKRNPAGRCESAD